MFSLIFPVVCTVIGVAVSSGATWFSGYQSTSLVRHNACVQRIDERETLLREKAGLFLAALGDFMNYPTFSQSSSIKDLSESAGPLMKAGVVMVAYAPGKLAVQSLKITESVRQGVLASMNQADEDAALATVQDSFGKWPSAYAEALGELNAERMGCERR